MTRQELKDFRRSYFFPTLECSPIGNVADANLIIGMSFGRNTFKDADLLQTLIRFGFLSGLTSFEIFKQLEHAGFDPGLSNTQIAERVWDEREKNPQAQVFCQWEVAYAIFRDYPIIMEKNDAHRHFHVTWPSDSGKYFDSSNVLVDIYRQTRYMVPTQTRRALIVAQDYHIARVVAIAWKIGFEVMTGEPGLKDFDPKSVQPYTKNLNAWLPREYVVRLAHHPIKGKVRLSPPSPLTEPTLAAV